MDLRQYFEPVGKGVMQSPRGPFRIYKNGSDYYALNPETGQPISTGVTKTNLINRMNSAEPLGIEKAAAAAKSSAPSKKALNIAMQESMLGTQEQQQATEAAIKEEPKEGTPQVDTEVEEILGMAK